MERPYSLNELRKMFLEFFESKGHLAMKSFSLIPHNDNSLLLINSGMAPLKPYFTGAEIPPRRRVTTCQKCIRTGDLENVGKTARHGTFFEMLGNFSFGDYFKHEAIAWSWEFLTQVVGLDPDRLYPSIYQDDDEAFDIWNKEIGIAPERIFRFGKEDNFWEHGAGPCGPCSEIYYDRGEKYGCGKPGCTVGCDCDRYMEVWNNVFSQFNNDGHNHYTDLIQKNIDTGMGLERLAVVVQDVDSIFDVDTIQALRNKVCDLAGVKYLEKHETDVSIRIITDHIRSATFMISDGIMPSNEGRGYVLRRLIRRAARHGRLLGIEGKFLAKLSETVIETSKDGYPELEEKKEFIFNVLTQEEDKFNKTIDQGLSILNEMEEKLSAEGKKVLDGADAFKLYDTYGFPMDLTKEILEEKGYDIDEEGFTVCMQEQRQKARDARKVSNYMGKDATVYDEIDPSVTSVFVGYEKTECESPITVLTTETELTDALTDGQTGTIITQETCGRLALAFGFVLDRCKMQIVRILLKSSEFRNAERIMKNALLNSHKALIPLRKITLCKIDVYTLRHICVQFFGHILKPSYFIRCSRWYRRAHLKAGAAARLSLTAIVIVVILVTNKILSAAFAVLKNSPAFKQKVYFQIYYRLEAVRNVHLLRQRTHRCYYRVQHRIRFFGNIILYLSKDVHRLAVRMQSGKRSVLALIFNLGKCRSGYRL